MQGGGAPGWVRLPALSPCRLVALPPCRLGDAGDEFGGEGTAQGAGGAGEGADLSPSEGAPLQQEIFNGKGLSN